jgi:hypothetical protein
MISQMRLTGQLTTQSGTCTTTNARANHSARSAARPIANCGACTTTHSATNNGACSTTARRCRHCGTSTATYGTTHDLASGAANCITNRRAAGTADSTTDATSQIATLGKNQTRNQGQTSSKHQRFFHVCPLLFVYST